MSLSISEIREQHISILLNCLNVSIVLSKNGINFEQILGTLHHRFVSIVCNKNDHTDVQNFILDIKS